MMLRAQFEEPQTPPATVTSSPSSDAKFSLLDNRGIQAGLVATQDFGQLLDSSVRRWFAATKPQARLALLKTQQFKSQGREHRIRTSLAAVDAPEQIQLSVREWIELVAEIDDED